MDAQGIAKLSLFAFDYPQMEEVVAQYNPEELVFNFSPIYDSVDIIGSTNKPEHYSGTDNPTVPVNLRFWAVTSDEMRRLYDARKFLLRAVYPVSLVGVTSAPTRILLTLPNLASFTGTIKNLSIKHLHWDSAGRIRNFEAQFDFQILPGREVTETFIDSAGFMWASGSDAQNTSSIAEEF